VRLLARREHSRRELQTKLSLRGLAPEDSESALDVLEAKGFLSDARFCEAYVHSRRNRGFGPARIAGELKAKGVAAELIDSSVDERNSSWLEQAKAIHLKRFRDTDVIDGHDYARRMRFLMQRGFSAEMVRCVLKFDE
jgi:regulatory protein